jgi:hypothetical protein
VQAQADIRRMDDLTYPSSIGKYHSVFVIKPKYGTTELGLISYEELQAPRYSWMPDPENLTVQNALGYIKDRLITKDEVESSLTLRVLLICDRSHTEDEYIRLICQPLARAWSCEDRNSTLISFLSECTLATKGQQKALSIGFYKSS